MRALLLMCHVAHAEKEDVGWPQWGIERATWNNPLLTTFYPCASSISATLWVLWCFEGNSQVKLRARDPFPLRHLAGQLRGRVYRSYPHRIRHYYTWLLRGLVFRAAGWKREHVERWLQQHSEFFAANRGTVAPSEPFSDVER